MLNCLRGDTHDTERAAFVSDGTSKTAYGAMTQPEPLPAAAALPAPIDDEIKEYHFHVYWFLNDPKTEALAMALRQRILELNDQGYFVAVPLATVNRVPRGPHPIGSYEVWVPFEHFARAYSFFTLNRPDPLIILLHPLTRHEVIDHTTRAVYLGGPAALPLKVDELTDTLSATPAQYPHLGLGYSAPKTL
ncbi:hypothetical protein HK105_202922 [Polyrhizophydium stewartii]|uniref:DOPA 4,5-dioxygenase n=1 Tax=Polyrhizophydium stewartii TaxID=2732419 RepID=A0ABR4NDN7_9FUNG|nr:hypothetical protein HK105_005346 [Polyrhizophydium stewartii]